MSRRRALTVLPLVLLVAALAACTESPRIPPPEPTSATQPLFATDEEALEAATEAYEEYLAVLDGLLQSPRVIDGDFDTVAAGEALELAEESVQQFLDDALSISGPRRLGSINLQQVIPADNSTEVLIYVCEDVSGVLLLDENGASLTTPDRPNYAVFEVAVSFDLERGRVIDRQFWSNESSC